MWRLMVGLVTLVVLLVTIFGGLAYRQGPLYLKDNIATVVFIVNGVHALFLILLGFGRKLGATTGRSALVKSIPMIELVVLAIIGLEQWIPLLGLSPYLLYQVTQFIILGLVIYNAAILVANGS